jgi:Domain of unknown function (DUF4430)
MFQRSLLKKTFVMLLAVLLLIAQGGMLSNLKVEAEVLKNGVTISAIDEDGNEVLPMTALEFEEGATAFDALEQLKANGIAIEYKEYDGMPGKFVKQIGNVAEDSTKNYWAFYINGAYAQDGISTYKIQNGDNLLFKLTDFNTQEDPIRVDVSVIGRNNEEIVKKQKVEIVKGATAYDALHQAIGSEKLDVTVYSDFFTMVNNIENYLKENEYFSVLVDNQELQVGLISYQLSEGEHLILKAASFDSTEPDKVESSQAIDPKQLEDSIEKALSVVQKNFQDNFYDILSLKTLGKDIPKKFMEQEIQRVIDQEGKFQNVTDLVKKILNITAFGKDVTNLNGINLIDELTNHKQMKKQGNNGPIFALLALDSGNYETDHKALWTREKLKQEILNQQLNSGGWALFGDSPSPDMTGMALAALAPYKEEPDVKSAIEKAVQWLKDLQQAAGTGGFYDEINGGDSSETVAQVIIGLTAIGIDPASSEFTVNDINLVEHLLSFQTSDGGFQHLKGDNSSNNISTSQGLLALVAYQKYLDGKGSIYQIIQKDIQDMKGDKLQSKSEKNNFELIIYGAILLIVAVGIFVYYKKRKMKSS